MVVPQIGDQPYWAKRVAELGIGAAHGGAVPTTESLPAALDVALAPKVRIRAREVASEIRADGAEAAAKWLIERLGQ
ncbi:MAG: glycosyltransferase family 1 protein [Mesorhizobium sp.]|nr:MAG: glycosyltransferase family 1 protein [Mesorhizobium sp.]